jgi:hypothetical protein
MIAVIADSELPLYHLGNAGRGPQIRSVAMRDRSFEEQSDQALALSFTQLPRATGRETHLQRFRSASPLGIPPAHHRTSTRSNPSSYFVKRKTKIQQGQSSLAPVFQ